MTASYFKQLWTQRELLRCLVSRELKSRYKGSALGFLWSILTPLFMAVIYVVFLRILAGGRVPMDQILIGVFAWQFTVQSVQGGMTAVTGSSNLVKKVRFARILLPTSTTAAYLVNYLLSLLVQFPLVIGLLWWQGETLSAGTVGLPLLVLYHALFNLGLAFWLSAANVYFRDTQHLVGVLLSAWFFLSPVMYNIDFLKGFASAPWVRGVYMLNPMAVVITAYRSAMLPGVAFPWSGWALAGAVLPAALFVGGLWMFERAQRNFADML